MNFSELIKAVEATFYPKINFMMCNYSLAAQLFLASLMKNETPDSLFFWTQVGVTVPIDRTVWHSALHPSIKLS